MALLAPIELVNLVGERVPEWSARNERANLSEQIGGDALVIPALTNSTLHIGLSRQVSNELLWSEVDQQGAAIFSQADNFGIVARNDRRHTVSWRRWEKGEIRVSEPNIEVGARIMAREREVEDHPGAFFSRKRLIAPDGFDRVEPMKSHARADEIEWLICPEGIIRYATRSHPLPARKGKHLVGRIDSEHFVAHLEQRDRGITSAASDIKTAAPSARSTMPAQPINDDAMNLRPERMVAARGLVTGKELGHFLLLQPTSNSTYPDITPFWNVNMFERTGNLA